MLWAFVLYLALASIAMILLAIAAYRLRETTMVAPLCWAIATVAIWSAVLLTTQVPSESDFVHDYPTMFKLVAFISFCPALAVLGARRPQTGAWQFVVLALLATAAMGFLPQVLAGHTRAPPHTIWQWFYLVLILVGWINYLPTRFGLAATILAIGQIVILESFLPIASLIEIVADKYSLVIGEFAIPTAAILAALAGPWAVHSRSQNGWTRVWRDFRNLYGLIWALRVMERTNAFSQSSGLSVRLDWNGFWEPSPVGESSHPPSPSRQPASPEAIAALEPALRNLLRRFVSNRWIDERLITAPAPAGD